MSSRDLTRPPQFSTFPSHTHILRGMGKIKEPVSSLCYHSYQGEHRNIPPRTIHIMRKFCLGAVVARCSWHQNRSYAAPVCTSRARAVFFSGVVRYLVIAININLTQPPPSISLFLSRLDYWHLKSLTVYLTFRAAPTMRIHSYFELT